MGIKIDKWISVEKELPPSCQKVIVVFENTCGNIRCTTSQYTAPKTVLADDFLDNIENDCSTLEDYDEQNDCFWVIEGWWEFSEEAEIQYQLSNKVTHWMRLPKLPEKTKYV